MSALLLHFFYFLGIFTCDFLHSTSCLHVPLPSCHHENQPAEPAPTRAGAILTEFLRLNSVRVEM